MQHSQRLLPGGPMPCSLPRTDTSLAGRVDYQCALPASLIPLIQADRLKGIATLSKERNPGLPNLPSAHEQGLTGFDVKLWYAFFMPKGAPEPFVRRLSEATNDAMNTPSVQEKVQALAATIVTANRRSPDYLQRFVLSDIEKWAVPIKAAGISLD
jgi:tripartite-type tricarboxylate transporter receptor subunit TctC